MKCDCTRESGNASRLKNYICISTLCPLLIHCPLFYYHSTSASSPCISNSCEFSKMTLEHSWLTFLSVPANFVTRCYAYLSDSSPSIPTRFFRKCMLFFSSILRIIWISNERLDSIVQHDQSIARDWNTLFSIHRFFFILREEIRRGEKW